MVNFVKPNLLGNVKEFKNRFVNPITNGQCRDSNSYDVRRMKQRAHILHQLLIGTVQVSILLFLPILYFSHNVSNNLCECCVCVYVCDMRVCLVLSIRNTHWIPVSFFLSILLFLSTFSHNVHVS